MEIDPGHVLLVDLSEGDRPVEKVHIGKWHFIERKFPMNGSADIDALDEWLEDLRDKSNTILKLSFEGTIHLTTKLRLDDTLERAKIRFGALEHWDRHKDLAVIGDDSDFGNLNLSGFAAEALQDLQDAARRSGPEREGAAEALALVFRLAGGVA